MSNMYIHAPIPKPAHWIFTSNPQAPAGHLTLAAARMHRRHRPGRTAVAASSGVDDAISSGPIVALDVDAVSGDLARLIELFACMTVEQREHIVELARQMLESESVPEVG